LSDHSHRPRLDAPLDGDAQPTLIRLDARDLDHLGPFLGFVRDELAEARGRHRHRLGAQFGKPRLQLGVSQSGIALRVELGDDLGGRVLWRAEAVPGACLIAWYEITHRGDVRQKRRTRRTGDCQRPQLAGPDVADPAGYVVDITWTCPPSMSVNAGAAPR
jgi:hypothetical protein